MLGAFFRPDAEPPVPTDPLRVGELETRHRKKRLSCEARRDRFWRLGKTLGIAMRGEECPQRLGLARSGGGRGAQKLQELLSCANGKAVGRVGHDDGVYVI